MIIIGGSKIRLLEIGIIKNAFQQIEGVKYRHNERIGHSTNACTKTIFKGV
jgi:hypothetical protein